MRSKRLQRATSASTLIGTPHLKKPLYILLAASLLAAPAVIQAQAAPPVASNAFIQFGGLNWAWASPCSSGIGASCGNDVVFFDGWRYATPTEWAARPLATAFLDPLGNFLGSGGQMRCASSWFGSGYSHCDFSDATFLVPPHVMSGPNNPGNTVDFPSQQETWIVKDLAQSTVPEPSTYALMAAGLAALGFVSRRRRAKQV